GSNRDEPANGQWSDVSGYGSSVRTGFSPFASEWTRHADNHCRASLGGALPGHWRTGRSTVSLQGWIHGGCSGQVILDSFFGSFPAALASCASGVRYRLALCGRTWL